MDKFIKVLQVIYYIIFIPLGILLVAFIIYLVVSNPLGKLMGGGFGGPGGGFGGGQPGGGFGQQGGFPTEEMIEQFKRQGDSSQGGNQQPSQPR